ncbi:transcriptional regulator [Alteromonas aestuariivivens]|uniref:Transcriptional regulator n=1 Tax=Alteromonas aestuariivivens TaxID=1938339 RepID=A0A3D8M7S0_9ALTE|nr:helix-turn-helix transcriptional regulator [Alteromonas aestuariivivens]RDV25604.1 transcriptional regulator [Alteromonas aestuariivivens]
MSEYRITNRVREMRFFAHEMTQQELAERVGVTRQTIMAIEKGKYSPSLEVAFKIAQVFNQPLDALFQYQCEIDR